MVSLYELSDIWSKQMMCYSNRVLTYWSNNTKVNMYKMMNTNNAYVDRFKEF